MPLEQTAQKAPPEDTINFFDGPIPGQSMVASPDSKMPWDGPPVHSSVNEASQAIFLDLLKKENLKSVVDLLQQGTPVSDIAQVLLMAGFSKGQFNPDTLLLLVEPVMYMIMAIGDKFGIEDVKIYRGEEEDDMDDEDDISVEENREDIQESFQNIFRGRSISPDLRKTIESSEIEKKLAGVDVGSLMAKPEAALEPERGEESLMAREEQQQEEIRGPENARR